MPDAQVDAAPDQVDVLIVDDNPHNLEAVVALLADLCRVISAG
ncbi:MAG: hypothetical protein AB1641_23460 [Thermodesulfobacteriota bacterium]